MRVTAYPLYENAAALKPAASKLGESVAGPGGQGGPGFDLLCPHAFEATWNGGPGAEDVEIRFPERAEGAAGAFSQEFVQSLEGEGLLTFHPGHQLKTESGQVLWVRGPINTPKDGLAPLETMIDSSVLPCTFLVHWKFTRPGHSIRFEAGEPFCMVVPYAKGGLQEVELEVVRLDDEDACERAFQEMLEEPAFAGVFRRLGAAAAQPAAPAAPEKRADPEEVPFPPPFHVIPPPPALPAERLETLFRGDYPARISVILPATNESVLLQRTVEQFEATLPADSEIIVIDNGSTDGCADFLRNGGARESVHLLRAEIPLGVAAARNHGLARARGEIVVFSDAHMDVPERWWQPIAETLNRPEVGVVCPGIGAMGNPDRPVGFGQRIAETTLRLEWLPKKAQQPYPVPTMGGGFMAMRHDTLKRAGAFDEGMPQWGSEDVELCVRYWLLGYEAWVAPEVTVLHYFRKQRPYRAESRLLVHNVLRVSLLHFKQERMGRVISALRNYARFGPALALASESDVWQKRAELAARRVRDDDWLFEKFSDCCHV